jgi:hypothetical protein
MFKSEKNKSTTQQEVIKVPAYGEIKIDEAKGIKLALTLC